MISKTIILLFVFVSFTLIEVDGKPRPFLINTYNDGYGQNTIEELAITRHRQTGCALSGDNGYVRRFGGRLMRRRPPVYRYLDPYGRSYQFLRTGVVVKEVVDDGPTVVIKNVPMRPSADPTKISLEDVPVVPANEIVYLRQPFIIILPANATTAGTTTTTAASGASSAASDASAAVTTTAAPAA